MGAEIFIISEVMVVSEVLGSEDELFQAAVTEKEEVADGSTMGVKSV